MEKFQFSIKREASNSLFPKDYLLKDLLMFVFAVEGRRPERADGQQAEVRIRPAAWLGAEQRGGEIREGGEGGKRQRQESGGRYSGPGRSEGEVTLRKHKTWKIDM